MKAFHFRLEKLLDLKQNELKEKVRDLQKVQRKLNEKRHELENVQSSLVNSVELKIGQASNIQKILSYKNQLLDCEVSLLDQIEFLVYQENQIQTSIQKVRNEEKAYEKLKDKEFKKHLYHFNKLEQKEMDEIAQRRFTNR
jgi:flagellar protein FliJ